MANMNFLSMAVAIVASSNSGLVHGCFEVHAFGFAPVEPFQ